MSEFDRLWKITQAEIAKHAPKPDAISWVRSVKSDFKNTIDDVQNKIYRFRKKGDVAAYKKALKVYYKLHLKAFKNYSEEYQLPRPSDPAKLHELTTEEIKRLRLEENDWEISTPAGNFRMVDKVSGTSDQVEFTPESLNTIIRVLLAFPGSIVTDIRKAESGNHRIKKSDGVDLRPSKAKNKKDSLSSPSQVLDSQVLGSGAGQETFKFADSSRKET